MGYMQKGAHMRFLENVDESCVVLRRRVEYLAVEQTIPVVTICIAFTVAVVRTPWVMHVNIRDSTRRRQKGQGRGEVLRHGSFPKQLPNLRWKNMTVGKRRRCVAGST